jgi:IS5 family transposase
LSIYVKVEDFFRNRLDQLIGLRYPLGDSANRMPWQIEASLVHHFARKVLVGKRIEGMDNFGPTQAKAGEV